MTATIPIVHAPEIRLNGATLSADLASELVDVRVEQSTTVASRFSLRFRDPQFRLIDSGSFDVGTSVEIAMVDDGGTRTTLLVGEVATVAVEQGAGERHELVISGYDASHRLAHESKVKTFVAMDSATIVRAIATSNGLRAKVDATVPKHRFPYLLQTTTDYAFLQELAARSGCEWFVEGTTLVFGPRSWTSGPTLRFGNDLRRFKARYSAAEHVSSVTVQGWDVTTRQPVAFRDTTTPANPSVATMGSDAPMARRSRAKVGSTGAVTHGGAVVEMQAEARMLANSIAARRASAEFTARGEAIGRPELRAGATVTIADMGSSLSGTYYLTSVEHVFGAGRPLLTRFTVGGLEPTSLVDLLGRPSGGIAPWGRLGLTVGIVTNNADPDHLGRVKVRFPALSDAEESTWARVVSPGAGAGRGLLFLPEIDDEVLVAFEHGDLRRPFVLGGLWNGRDRPMEGVRVHNGKVVQWAIQSRRGHVVTVDDGESTRDGAFVVTLADGRTRLRVGEDKIELWSNNRPLQLKAGEATVTLDGNGNMSLKGNTIGIEASGKLTLKGAEVDVRSDMTTKVHSGGPLEMNANGPTKLESVAIVEVKGSLLKFN